MKMIHPFDLLFDFEQRVLQSDISLPEANNGAAEWVGLGFRIGKNRLLADMGQVREILELPEFTMVPGVKSWVIGVANVRGSLLPIMDLKGYILGEDILKRRKGRVIVIEYKGFNTGLLVEEIFGMRHFVENDEVRERPELDEAVMHYIERNYKQGEEHWPVFSVKKMTSEERFSQASL